VEIYGRNGWKAVSLSLLARNPRPKEYGLPRIDGRKHMSPPPSQFFKIPLQLKKEASRQVAIDQARKRIFEKLGIRGAPPISDRGNGNRLDVIDRLNERLLEIISKCEQFAVDGKITLIVSLNGGYTPKSARNSILSALFFECEEAKLAKLAQDAIDDLKEFKRKADREARIARENKIVEDALQRILPVLAISEYCSIHPVFKKNKQSFEISFIQYEPTHPWEPLPEEEYFVDPVVQKNHIRGLLRSILSSGFPFRFYYYQWDIYTDDPEDFESADVEFRNLIDDEIGDDDVRLGERIKKERREAYQKAIRAAGGALSFVSNFFFEHLITKALYSIPGVGTAMMIYDLAQLAADIPDDVRTFSKILLDEEEL
jgi:hypothetical protein